MLAHKSVDALFTDLNTTLNITDGKIAVLDEKNLQNRIYGVVYTAVFGTGLVRDTARWLLWELGQTLGIYPASIHELYLAVGRGDLPQNFTVPAINVRGMTFNTARAIFRAANKHQVGAFLFEIARSEIGYTDQRPAEYISSLIGAAIKEGYRGPLYVQGDHFQISLKGYKADPEKEVNAVKELMAEAIEAGFYNIDIDTSTLVDLDFETLAEQQEKNYALCAELTHYARTLEPEGITVSLGGEIGEVGGHNSTVPELRAFMDGYQKATADIQGISKISVQTGTSHGGVVLPDGTLADVKVDFDTLNELGKVARNEYKIGGAVQHGASTLPPTAFGKFPEISTLEIHLATGFQNMIYDNAPEFIVDAAYNYVLSNLRHEWKDGQTEDQFIYSTRKKAFGALKKQWWDLSGSDQMRIGSALEDQFSFLFDTLNVKNSKEHAAKTTPHLKQHRPQPTEAIIETDLDIASDLAD